MDAGVEALTLTNTVFGMVINPETQRPVLGNGGGGLLSTHAPSGARAVYDVYSGTDPDSWSRWDSQRGNTWSNFGSRCFSGSGGVTTCELGAFYKFSETSSDGAASIG